MHSVPVIMCFKTHVSILYFRHPFDYQIIYLINTSSASNSTSVDKLIHLIMEFILFMTPASLEPPVRIELTTPGLQLLQLLRNMKIYWHVLLLQEGEIILPVPQNHLGNRVVLNLKYPLNQLNQNLILLFLVLLLFLVSIFSTNQINKI